MTEHDNVSLIVPHWAQKRKNSLDVVLQGLRARVWDAALVAPETGSLIEWARGAGIRLQKRNSMGSVKKIPYSRNSVALLKSSSSREKSIAARKTLRVRG